MNRTFSAGFRCCFRLSFKCSSKISRLRLTPLNRTVSSTSVANRTHTCGELSRSMKGHEVSLCGWVHSIRFSKFLLLRDSYGIVQVYLPSELLKNLSITQSKLPPIESVVTVTGTVELRPQKDINKKLNNGDIEILASRLEVLNETSPEIPFVMSSKLPINELLRLTYRFIDIRSDVLQRNLRFRSNLILNMRKFLCDSCNFVEVETPFLFRKTPGGAHEFLTASQYPGYFYSLPQSPQQFKQLLMVGGIDRYMQIARCFRDEPSRSDRQPEFTQLDLEMAFITQENIFLVIQQLLLDSWKLVETVQQDLPPLQSPFPKMEYSTAISRFGSDKPDIRFDLTLCNLPAEDLIGFHVPYGYASVLNSSDWEWLLKKVKKITGLTVSYFNVASTPRGLHHFVEALEVSAPGTAVFIQGITNKQKNAIGLARTELAKLLQSKGVPIYKPGIHFLWVYNFPLFERNAEGKLLSVHHPFTAPTPESFPLVYTNPEQVIGQHYDLVCNGQEVGGGSIRIHNADLQRYIFSDVLHEDTSQLEYFLSALKCGAPPHGGIAIGLDRLISIFLNTSSIRDVIAFPKSADGKDLMCGAPAKATKEDLEYYHIALTEK